MFKAALLSVSLLVTIEFAACAIPQELEPIPGAYWEPSSEPGVLTDLYYDTYESFSYTERTNRLRKHAVVYLPHGYTPTGLYDVFYLMHGGWGDENSTLGTPSRPSAFKNVIDHAIAVGEVRPLILVCPTYNNTNQDGLDSASFSLAMKLTENFPRELKNDLIPAVERTFRTFTGSRDHRGFGGFSMGAVTTWRTFQYALDDFRYFLPMSCGTSLNDEEIFRAARGGRPGSYFIFVMTGTEDFAYSFDESRAAKLRASPSFAYRVKKGYSHDGKAASEYTYNGLKAFWGTKEAPSLDNYTTNSKIKDVISDPAFGTFGRLLFPSDTGYFTGDTLGRLALTWYGPTSPRTTVAIVNSLKSRALAGDQVFFDLYSDLEKSRDPAKKNTGLFFFRGKPGAKTALVNAGGGFAYVGAMHDSFPHALALSQKGYNAFALIYRPGAQTACEDLARAISFLHKNAATLGITMKDYSLWGGSAGARMAAWLGNSGTEPYGEGSYPRASAVIMQYTGLSEVTGREPPTYACVGTNDGIASYRTMQDRIQRIKANGTAAEIEVFPGLSHGFGLGEGTVAEGWLDRAVRFWEAPGRSF